MSSATPKLVASSNFQGSWPTSPSTIQAAARKRSPVALKARYWADGLVAMGSIGSETWGRGASMARGWRLAGDCAMKKAAGTAEGGRSRRMGNEKGSRGCLLAVLRGDVLRRRRGRALLTVALTEFLDTPGRIDDLLFSGIERMTCRAHFDMQ